MRISISTLLTLPLLAHSLSLDIVEPINSPDSDSLTRICWSTYRQDLPSCTFLDLQTPTCSSACANSLTAHINTLVLACRQSTIPSSAKLLDLALHEGTERLQRRICGSRPESTKTAAWIDPTSLPVGMVTASEPSPTVGKAILADGLAIVSTVLGGQARETGGVRATGRENEAGSGNPFSAMRGGGDESAGTRDTASKLGLVFAVVLSAAVATMT